MRIISPLGGCKGITRKNSEPNWQEDETQIEAGPIRRFKEDGLDCSMEASRLTGGLPLSR